MPRRKAVDVVTAIARGGPAALAAARQLVADEDAKGDRVTMRVSRARKARWEAAAKRAGVSLTEWLERAADAAEGGR